MLDLKQYIKNWDPNACLKCSPALFQPSADPLRHRSTQGYQQEVCTHCLGKCTEYWKPHWNLILNFYTSWRRERDTAGGVRAASQLDVISPLRNLSPSYSGQEHTGRWAANQVSTCGNSTTAHAAFYQRGDATFSLCEASALCREMRSAALRYNALRTLFLGKRIAYRAAPPDSGCPFNFATKRK